MSDINVFGQAPCSLIVSTYEGGCEKKESVGENMACAETRGFLFGHDCAHEAVADCGKCGRKICSMHTRTALGRNVCISCFRAWVLGGTEQGQGALAEQTERKRRRAYEKSSEEGSWYSYDDPYLYLDTHHPDFQVPDFSSGEDA